VRGSAQLILLALFLTGCSGGFELRSSGLDYPSDAPALAPFGLALRCRPGVSDCADAALSMQPQLALSLLAPYEGEGIVDTSGSPVEGSLIIVFHRDPAIQWTGGDRGGETTRMAVDLGPYAAGRGPAYAVVDDADGGTLRYGLPDPVADALVEALYVRP
jgi:hypothetical protein